MPTIEQIHGKATDGQGRTTESDMQLRAWTKMDAKSRALKWGGGVLGIAVLILPIPIVHFGAIPIVLFGVPLVTFVVYRVYSGGTDLTGQVKCPACGAESEVNTSGDRWPVHRICSDCRASYQLTRS